VNDVQARLAIRQLITNNDELLVDGLMLQGEQVLLRQVAISGNTPPSSFPFVSITVPDSSETDVGGNTLWNEARAEYSMLITVLSMAIAQEGDVQVYEQTDINHSLICDRIIALLKDRNNRWLIEFDSQLKFELARGTAIAKRNFHSGLIWEQDTGYHSRLATEIRFSLAQGCTDDTVLYS